MPLAVYARDPGETWAILAPAVAACAARHAPPAGEPRDRAILWLPSSPGAGLLAQRASVGDAMRASAGTASLGATAAGVAAERRPGALAALAATAATVRAESPVPQ
jgi:hypothetical protein